MKKTENSAPQDNRKSSIIIIKPIKKIESLTEESLRTMYMLQSTLDINILIEIFDNELKKMVSHDYLNYKNSVENINGNSICPFLAPFVLSNGTFIKQ